MLSAIWQIYWLRANAVALDWREDSDVEIISSRPCSKGAFHSSGNSLYKLRFNIVVYSCHSFPVLMHETFYQALAATYIIDTLLVCLNTKRSVRSMDEVISHPLN